MANKNQVVGQVRIIVDGTTYPTSGESTMEIGGIVREAVAGDYEAGAFKEMTQPAKCSTSLLYKSGISLSSLRDADDVTVIMDCDNGTSWIMRNAYTADMITFSQDGKAAVVFQSGPAEEVL